MFREFSKLAFPVAITGIIMASMADGVGVLIPIVSMGGVIYVLFHAAKGFESADRKRRDRY